MSTILATTPTSPHPADRKGRRPLRALVSLIALSGAPGALAQVVHVDPPDIPLPAEEFYRVDLNDDGRTDFTLLALRDGSLLAAGYTVGWIAQPWFYASRLAPGHVIDIEAGWITTLCNDAGCRFPVLFTPEAPRCDWPPGESGLLGVAFPDLNGRIHFGWIRVSPACGSAFPVLTDWAYESTPFSAILAGDQGLPCPPTILAAPAPVSAFAGDEVRFAVSAEGRDLKYDWFFNGEPLTDGPDVAGSHEPILRLTDVRSPNVGAYAVRVSSPCGDTEPPAVKLDVLLDCPPFDGQAYSNDGSPGYVEVPDAPALDLRRTATLEAWFRPADGAPASRLISKGDGINADTDRALDITWMPDGNGGPGAFAAEFFLGPPHSAPGNIGALSLSLINPHAWNHIAATLDVDAGVCKLYVNGAPAGETTTLADGVTPIPPLDVRDSSFPLFVGATPPFTYFKGRIDDVRVWSVARTPEEIAANFNSAVDPATPGLVAYYRFDDGPADSVGEHNGVVLGSARLVHTYPCCPADFNRDAFVDFFDYIDFVACFDGTECPAGVDADFNRDGFTDFFDYLDFVTAFETGCR